MSRIGLMLLAAGASSRMGRPKQLLEYNGTTLLRRATETAVRAGCAPVTVVLGSRGEEFLPELAGLDVAIALNPRWSVGMGSSIRCGLANILQSSPDVQAVIVTLCDQPLVEPEDLQKLVRAFQKQGVEMCASKYGTSFGPPCLFGKAMFEKLRAMEERAGAKALIKGNVAWIECERAKVDVDTLKDWEDLRAGGHGC